MVNGCIPPSKEPAPCARCGLMLFNLHQQIRVVEETWISCPTTEAFFCSEACKELWLTEGPKALTLEAY